MRLHINNGFTDMLVDYKDREIYEIKIEVTPKGNLIRDLNDFPLSKDKKIKAPKNGKHLLSFPPRRTHQLLEYIVGRGSAFKVVAPDVVVADIKKVLGDALKNY